MHLMKQGKATLLSEGKPEAEPRVNYIFLVVSVIAESTEGVDMVSGVIGSEVVAESVVVVDSSVLVSPPQEGKLNVPRTIRPT